MLLITDAGFIEILKEPQFPQHVTVRAHNTKSLQPLLDRMLSGQVFLNPDEHFEYRTIAYADEVKLAYSIAYQNWLPMELPYNISPNPVGYQILCRDKELEQLFSRYVYHSHYQDNLGEISKASGSWLEYRWYPVYAKPDELYADDDWDFGEFEDSDLYLFDNNENYWDDDEE